MPTEKEAEASEWTTKFAWLPKTFFGTSGWASDRTIWLTNYITKK